MKLYTTLNKIREHSPCEDSWKKLLKSLGKTKADDKKLALATILKHLNLGDALWALRVVDGHEREMRLFACDCAERVLPIYEKQHPDDKRPRHAIEVARLYARGKATSEELSAAWDAAWDAWAASAVAWDAAWDAARVARAASDAVRAAREAARDVARDAAWTASAASAAASAAAWDARAAEKKPQIKLFKKYFC